MIKSSLACGLQACISQKWEKNEYWDITVSVEQVEFHCHRFILSACSTFFDERMRSENSQNSVVLENMSKDSFQAVLSLIYQGEVSLTPENVIQVWEAAQYLGIAYVVEECQDFAIQNMALSNYVTFYQHAKSFKSKKLKECAIKCMTDHFDHFKETDLFLRMSLEKITLMVDNHHLKTVSEDSVIDAIFKWMDYNFSHESTFTTVAPSTVAPGSLDNSACNDDKETLTTGDSPQIRTQGTEQGETEIMGLHENKKKHLGAKFCSMKNFKSDQILANLLKVARLCLASRECLQKLMKNPLITSNQDALNSVHESLLFHWKADCYSSNYVVRYRECSGLTNVMVFGNRRKVMLYSLQKNCFNELLPVTDEDDMKEKFLPSGIAAVSHGLCFATHNSFPKPSRTHIMLFEQVDNKLKICWKDSPSVKGIILSHQDKIFYVTEEASNFTMTMTSTNCSPFLCVLQVNVKLPSLTAATIFEDNIFIFISSENKTRIKRYNIETRQLKDLPEIKGPAQNIVSFQRDRCLYVLQKNGSLWQVVKTTSVNENFHFIEKLWNVERNLIGAVIFNDQLLLFCKITEPDIMSSNSEDSAEDDEQPDDPTPELPGLVNGVRFIQVESTTTAVPAVIPTAWIKESALA